MMPPDLKWDWNIAIAPIKPHSFIDSKNQDMIYYVLLVLYAILLIFHAWHYQPPRVDKWPLLDSPASKTTTTTTACQQTSDCQDHHVCLSQTCFPKILRGEECYPETGTWTLTDIYGQKFASCSCIDDRLVSQKIFGGNCDLVVACQPHGDFNYFTRVCECFEGYEAKGYTCQKLTALQVMDSRDDCDSDEIPFNRILPEHGFHDTYLQTHRDKKCFKRPCTFDALSGLALKNARYEEGVGCVCDPTLGQFGVRLEGNGDYIRGPGYNACASIFKYPLTIQSSTPKPVSIAAYFYLMDRQPAVFLQYTHLIPSTIVDALQPLVKDGNLQIAQEFPYDYMQVFFRERKQDYVTRTRRYDVDTYYMTQRKEEWNLQPNQMEWCRFIPSHISFLRSGSVLRYKSAYEKAQQRQWAWTLLYQFPACYIGENDLESPEKFRGRYVSNPLHMTLPSLFEKDPRFNGLLLRFQNDRWYLDFAPSLDVDTYIQAAIEATVPFIENDVVNGIVDNTLTRERLQQHQEEVSNAPKEVTFT